MRANEKGVEEKKAAERLGISPRFYGILKSRGIGDGDIPRFLAPSLDDLSSPFDIHGMREAAERVRLAVERGEKILVFGDYDCDGISAISILMLALKGRADADYFIPNRLTDGYGMKTSPPSSASSRTASPTSSSLWTAE